jgi:hypothetical protein
MARARERTKLPCPEQARRAFLDHGKVGLEIERFEARERPEEGDVQG